MKAYDGHMNLILSDVEETIMIVEQAEGALEGSTTVNVSSHLPFSDETTDALRLYR
jgi:small nuclear ribonucleoprotein (snRNP)-like protein